MADRAPCATGPAAKGRRRPGVVHDEDEGEEELPSNRSSSARGNAKAKAVPNWRRRRRVVNDSDVASSDSESESKRAVKAPPPAALKTAPAAAVAASAHATPAGLQRRPFINAWLSTLKPGADGPATRENATRVENLFETLNGDLDRETIRTILYGRFQGNEDDAFPHLFQLAQEAIEGNSGMDGGGTAQGGDGGSGGVSSADRVSVGGMSSHCGEGQEERRVGLINHGATCYLNTALQALFMTPLFRARVRELGAAGAAAGRGTAIAAMVAAAAAAAAAAAEAAAGGSAAVGPDAPPPVVTKALVELFDQLHRSQDAVSTRDLTNALNWAAVDQQQDAHEFVRVLFERIEGELKKTVHKRLIEDVFQGEKTDYVHCLGCNNITNTDAVFREFQLDFPSDGPARTGTDGPDAVMDVRAALSQIMSPEQLGDGERYRCARCQCLTCAERGMHLKILPPILTLHLKRFQYDTASRTHSKISRAFDFQLYLDMAPHMVEALRPESLVYELFAAVVHQGDTAVEGHYYALIKDEQDVWCTFDDEDVTPMEASELRAAVGGGAEAGGPSAYMLFYRQVTDPLRIPQALALATAGVVASVFGGGGGGSTGSGSASAAHKPAAKRPKVAPPQPLSRTAVVARALEPKAAPRTRVVAAANFDDEYEDEEPLDEDEDADNSWGWDQENGEVDGYSPGDAANFDDEYEDEDALPEDEDADAATAAAAEQAAPGGAATKPPQSRAEAINQAARSYGELPPAAQEPILRARRLLSATFASPMASWAFLKIHIENAPQPGEAAMIIEAAQHALPPEIFVHFARENAHWYRPETLRTIFRCGYWPLGATRAVVATIKELRPKGGRVAYCGACDGSGIEFGDALPRRALRSSAHGPARRRKRSGAPTLR